MSDVSEQAQVFDSDKLVKALRLGLSEMTPVDYDRMVKQVAQTMREYFPNFSKRRFLDDCYAPRTEDKE